MKNSSTSIKVSKDDLKLLALYKLENDLPSYTIAIRHAIERAKMCDLPALYAKYREVPLQTFDKAIALKRNMNGDA